LAKLAPQNFNDLLALLLIFILPILWLLHGMKTITLPNEVVGALIVTWTLIIQFYFRKAKTEE
jgi:hypothetical protein